MSDLKPINFTRGVPATESFPVEDVIDAAVASLKQHGRTMLQYGPATGFAPLVEWLASWQGVKTNQVLTGNGSLQLVDFLCWYLLDHDVAILDFRREKAHRFFHDRVHIFRMQHWLRGPDGLEKLRHDRIEPCDFRAGNGDRGCCLGAPKCRTVMESRG